MLKSRVLIAVALAAALALVFVGQQAVKAQEAKSAEKEYTILVPPTCDTKDVVKKFGSMSEYLSQQTGLNIKIKIVETPDDFKRELHNVDFAMQDGYGLWLFNRTAVEFEPVVIAVNKYGVPKWWGAIVVKADSDIWSIDQLRGKRFVFGPQYTYKYYAAYMDLVKAGINPEKDLAGYSFGYDCAENAMKVFKGEADAASIGLRQYLKGSRKKYNWNWQTDMRLLGETEPSPHRIFTASKKTNKKIVKDIKRLLLELKKDSPICKALHINGFMELPGGELKEIDANVKKYKVPIQ